ncbi:MAG: acetylglutamate kinase [Anaerolineales bacterium]|nr:acetylglutamate kinase [Anaerolineales bacterium]
MSKPIVVIKVGGNDLEKPDFIPQLTAAIAQLQADVNCILVHGGGRKIDALMNRLEIKPQYVDGQRVTDEAVLEVAELVLSGQVNKRLVRALLQQGVDSIGISGVDGGLIQVEPWSLEMGRVGRVVAVRGEVLGTLIAAGFMPVVSPISLGAEGSYNVNADHAAAAIARAVDAQRVVFLTNVPGVMVGDEIMAQLSHAKVQALIQSGAINGGMVPKVTAALETLKQGVSEAHITNLAGLQAGRGTTLYL